MKKEKNRSQEDDKVQRIKPSAQALSKYVKEQESNEPDMMLATESGYDKEQFQAF